MNNETILATISCSPEKHRGVVSVPVYRASTILFPTLAEFEAADIGACDYAVYGRYGTPTSEALEEAIAAIENADNSIVVSSGIGAIAVAFLTFLNSGDHVLVADSVYGPTRRFCDYELKRFGVETTYYDPCIGAGIEDLIRPNTKVIFLESPGSLTFEMQDIPAIANAAHKHDIVVIADNTWATPLFMKAFDLGIDIPIHSVTKYMSGHSDIVMGVISCKSVHYKKLLHTFRNIGARPSGDDCYLALRGMRTMAVRVKHQYEAGLKVANWLANRPEVAEVLHPALQSCAGHDIWKRDCTGATSLFSIVLKNGYSHAALSAMLDGLEYFGMGYSWGGFESLIITCTPQKIRTATKWTREGYLLRIHVGLENTDDLIADLEKGFARLKAVG